MKHAYVVLSFFVYRIITSGANKTLCTPGFNKYEDTTDKSKLICVKFFTSTEDWDHAHDTCKRLQSHLFDFHVIRKNFNVVRDFSNEKDVQSLSNQFTWLDMRRRSEYYMSNYMKPVLLDDTLPKWRDEIEWHGLSDTTFDCGALDLLTGELKTFLCNDIKFPFFCANDGFSTKPIEHPACAKTWVFSHYLQNPYGCIKLFPPAKYETAKETCKAEGAELAEKEDFNGLDEVQKNGYLNNFTSEVTGHWVKDPTDGTLLCNFHERYSPGSEPSLTCPDILSYICKQDLKKNIRVDVSISPKEILPFDSRFLHKKSLACIVHIDSRLVDTSIEHQYVKYLWLKDGILVSTEHTINLGDVHDETRLTDEFVNRRGSYRCTVEILGVQGIFLSNDVKIFFSDVVSFVAILNLTETGYTFWDYSNRNIKDFLPNVVKSVSLNSDKNISGDFSQTLLYWDLLNYRVQRPHAVLRLLCFFKWKSPNQRPKKADTLIYKTELILFEFFNASFQIMNMGSAGLCNARSFESENSLKARFWPASFTMQYAINKPLCLTEDGDAVKLMCLSNFVDGAYFAGHNKDCVKIIHDSNITTHLSKLVQETVTSENIIIRALKELRAITSLSDKLTPKDVQIIASLFGNIAESAVSNSEVTRLTAAIISNIMNVDEEILLTARMNSSNNWLTESFEKIVFKSTLQEKNLIFAIENVAVNIWQLDLIDKPVGSVYTSEDLNILTVFNDSEVSLTDYEAGIIIPSNFLAEQSKVSDRESRMSIIIYKNPSLLQPNRIIDERETISPVIHASFGSEPVWNLNPPVKISFRILREINASDSNNIICGFWNKSVDGTPGEWSDEGCTLLKVDGESCICQCNHLTNFGALLNPELQKDLGENKLYLSIISIIGCSLSMFGLGMTILTFLLFRKWRKGKKHQTLVNLSFSLMALLIIFLVGFHETGNKAGCMAVAILLHYFTLVTFAWMLVEALLQYLNLVKVYDTYIPRFMIKAMIFAWGTPLLIVCTVLGIDHKSYSGDRGYCWLAKDAFRFAFVLPVAILLVVNFFIFVLIMYSITCGRDGGIRSNQDARKMAIVRFRAAVCIYFLLGLSWLFGFVSINGVQLLFQYLFAITTTLQGFLIFVFFVAQEKDARDLWKNFLRCKKLSEKTSVTVSTRVTTESVVIHTKNEGS